MSSIAHVLKGYPALHAAAKQFYTVRLLSTVPVDHDEGFKFLGPLEMQAGTFEPDETTQIKQLLSECDVFVNIGANVGYYVCLARQMGSHVVAIEPLERNIQYLKSNLLLNGWTDVELYQMGCGDLVGLNKLFGGGTAASLVPGWAGAAPDTFELVAVSTLDRVLGSSFCGKQLLILMDVEGFELKVLQGATEQLRRVPAPIWFVEICINKHQPSGVQINPLLLDTFELFWQCGYHAFKAGCESGLVERGEVLAWSRGENLPRTHNFLFRIP